MSSNLSTRQVRFSRDPLLSTSTSCFFFACEGGPSKLEEHGVLFCVGPRQDLKRLPLVNGQIFKFVGVKSL